MENLKFKDKLRRLNKKRIALCTIGAIVIGTPLVSTVVKKFKKSDNNKSILYLMDIKNENKLKLYSKDGKIVDSKIDITKDMYVITDIKDHDKNSLYNVYIVNDNDEIQKCYIKGKNIKDSKVLDKVEVSDEFKESNEIDVVTPSHGSWLRQNKIVDRNTNEANLLPCETYVISSSIDSTSKYNNYYWKEILKIETNEKKLTTGYMINGYIMNANFDDSLGAKFKVNVQPGRHLNIRSESRKTSEVIKQLNENEEVVLVPNIETITSENIDWFYVAYKNDKGQVRFGYCAATEYINEYEKNNYLVATDMSFYNDKKYETKRIKYTDDSTNNEKIIEKEVSLNNCNVKELKLRKTPGLESEISHYLDEGTYLYTYNSEIKKMKYQDGYNWVKVYLIDGTCGYVANEYLIDYERNNDITDENVFSPKTYLFNNKIEVNGYFGVDVNNTVNSSLFEKLITTNNKYTDDYPEINESRKIDFSIIKLGATANGTGELKLIEQNVENLNSLLNVCEKNNLPYGLYYYAQSTSIEEADREIENILNLLNTVEINKKEYMKLPLYIDMEDMGYQSGCSYNTRIKTNAQIYGKQAQTNILNYIMNKLKEKTSLNICFYTDYNTLTSSIDFNEIEEQNKENCWIVDVSESHSKNIYNHYPRIYDYSKVRQIKVDANVDIEEYDDEIGVDYDIMDSSYYKRLTR